MFKIPNKISLLVLKLNSGHILLVPLNRVMCPLGFIIHTSTRHSAKKNYGKNNKSQNGPIEESHTNRVSQPQKRIQ